MTSNFPGNFDDLKLHNNGIFYTFDGGSSTICDQNGMQNINWISNEILDKGCFKFNPFGETINYNDTNLDLEATIN